MYRLRSLLLVLALAPAAALGTALPPGPLSVRVVDGDSLRIGEARVRLHGIDAPELNQTCTTPQGALWRCGQWSRAQLEAFVQGQRLDCDDLGADRHGRRLARCRLDGRDIAALMVTVGAAFAYRRYSDEYVPHETYARAAGRGIWAAGPQTSPEAHRRAAAAPSDAAPATGCTIKGNVGASGRIYHQPGQRDYAATRITVSKGEAWFCSPTEAEAAGFRPAAR